MMSQLKQLKAATTLSDIARLLDVKPGMLSFLLYIKPKESLYIKFDIPKRYGGIREISAPTGELKLIQHRLADLLQNCVQEVNEIHGHAEDGKHFGIAHGFKRKHSIMTNARTHVTRRYVFNVDLHDFFGTINFGRVRGFFLKDRNFELYPDVATVIAQIACHENKLPQGSPCSPVISNLIGHTLDIMLVRLAATSGSTYTRYADDLTFSCNKQSFPSRVAKLIDEKKNAWEPGHALKKIVAKSGFTFNDAKTRMQYRDSRQEVTGLVVNRKINVPATYRCTVRAMVDRALKTGSFEFVYKKTDKAGALTVETKSGTNQQLLGMLSYIDQVDQFNKKLYEDRGIVPPDTAGRMKLFRQFIYFDSFYAISAPVIVCEGPTDNIYIKHAIKRLAASYPMLVTSTSPPKLAVRLFKYGERRTSEVTQLTGGVGGLCHLLKNYHADLTERIQAPLPKHPVIVLIDNDNGANDIYGAIAGITKRKRPEGKKPFIYIKGNLYVVPTPLGPSDEKTAIEDFFDEATLATLLGTKKFSRKKTLDETKEYGKSAFAREVIDKNAETVDFSKFSSILDRIAAVLADYSVRISPGTS